MRIRLHNYLASGWIAFDDVEFTDPSNPGVNMVENPGFEDGIEGWTETRLSQFPGTAFWRSGYGLPEPYAGGFCHTISNLAHGHLASADIEVNEDTDYDLSVWVKGKLDPDESMKGLLIRARYYAADHSPLGFHTVFSDYTGSVPTETWQQVGGQITTPPGTEFVRIRLHNYLASGWIAFDDVEFTSVGLAFSAAAVSVNEHEGPAILDVVINSSSDDEITVRVTSTDGDALAGVDYTAIDEIVIFAPGETSRPLVIEITDDMQFEPHEYLTLSLSSPSGAALGAPDTTSVTIVDNDPPPTVALTLPASVVGESAGSVALTVVLSAITSDNVTVAYATADGTASAASDYTAASDTLTILAGQPSGTISVPITDDVVAEGDEDFTVTLSTPTGATLGTPATATVTITDDEGTPELSFSAATSSVGEGAGSVDLTVSMSVVASSDVTVDYATADGTAMASSDYTAASDTLTIIAGQPSGTITVLISDDAIAESNEDFTVTLSTPTGATLGTPATATVTITDDEGAPELSFSAATSSVGEGAGSVDLTVSMSVVASSDVTVDYATADGTAMASSDYTAASDTLTIIAGQTSGTIIVPITDDAVAEGDEDFTVTLNTPTGATLGTPDTAIVTITDDEGTPELSFSAATSSVGEGAGSVDLTVSMSVVASSDVTVDYATADGTAMASSDYTAASDTLTIIAGQTSGTIIVPITDDAVAEGDEDFTVTLNTPTGATLGTPATATVTINDDEGTPELSFSAATSSIGEDAGSVDLTVSMSVVAAYNVTVDYATADGTATAGSDYTVTSNTLTILAGQPSGTITVPITDDAIAEGDENFTVTLSTPTGATLGTPTTATVTINDNELVPPSATIEQLAGPVDEDAGLVQIRVLLSGPSLDTLQVPFRVEGSAGVSDFGIATSSPFEFQPGETERIIDVTITDDSDPEPTETVKIVLESSAGVRLGNPYSTEVLIQDNEGLPVAAVDRPFASSFCPSASVEEPHIVEMNGARSSVPAGYYVWFAVLLDGSGGGGAMDVAYYAPGLSGGSFGITETHKDYIVRLVITDTDPAGNDSWLRMPDLPCQSSSDCDSTEVLVEYLWTNNWVEAAYAFPEVVLFRRDAFERSSDGGLNWETVTGHPRDRDVEPGHTYHYRSIGGDDLAYLGFTTEGPGEPIDVPVWGAPRVIPTVSAVTWDIPPGLTIFDGVATVTLHLEAEPGDTLTGSTIEVFVNEETSQAKNWVGNLVPPDYLEWGSYPPDEGPVRSRDEPGCVTRRAQPDAVVTVDSGSEFEFEVPGFVYGANSLRLEVHHPTRGMSERAILLGVHEFPAEYYPEPELQRVYHTSFLPYFFSDTFIQSDPVIWGQGPVPRASPDCNDGDMIPNSAGGDQTYRAKALFSPVNYPENWISQTLYTDQAGHWTNDWSSSHLTPDDNTDYNVQMLPSRCDPADSSYAHGYAGHIGRQIAHQTVGQPPLTTSSTNQFVCNETDGPVWTLHTDFGIVDHTPQLTFSENTVKTDLGDGTFSGNDYIATSPVRFRITDPKHDVILDQNQPGDTISIENTTLELSGEVYYAADQNLNAAEDHFGWLIGMVPLGLDDATGQGVNDLVFFAKDRAGNELGGGAGVATTVTRVREIGFADAVFDVQEDGATAIVTVRLTAPSNMDIAVTYQIAEDSAGNAATAGLDFVAESGQVTILAGSLEGQFPVTVLPDDDTEPEYETVLLTIGSPPQSVQIGEQFEAILRIWDDDRVPVSAHVTATVDAPEEGWATIDGTASVVPNLGVYGGGVGMWALSKVHISSGSRSLLTTHELASPLDLTRQFLIPFSYDIRARLVVAADQATLDSSLEGFDLNAEDPPCTAAATDGYCDTFDLLIENPCRKAQSQYSPAVLVHSPPDGHRLGIGEPLHLEGEAYEHYWYPSIWAEKEWFGYRWTISPRDEPWWPLVRLGNPGSGGFDRDNRIITIPWTDIGLPVGDYTLRLEARYPWNCLSGSLYYAGWETQDFYISHSIGGVAPGKVVEGGTFRVYSSSLLDQMGAGGQAYVLIDDDPDPNDDTLLEYELTIQAGGFFELIADPLYLPAGTYYAYVTEDQSWAGLSAPVSFAVEAPGTAEAPNMIIDDESTTCGTGGVSVDGECAHPILPGQIWHGEWAEAGDTDYFTFIAGAGTEVRITLDRANTTLPPQHPDAPSPEILLVRADNLIVAASDPLPLDATGTELASTLTMNGRYFFAVRTPKGSGPYLVRLEKTVEGGSGSSAFGYNRSRVFLTTSSGTTAWFKTSGFDAFGNPISGSPVYWELGEECGIGEFCGSGSLSTEHTDVEGFVEIFPDTGPGAPQLWQASFTAPGTPPAKAIRRPGVVRRSPSTDPPLGRIETEGLMVLDSDLPDLATAHSIKERHQLVIAQRDLTKDGPLCNNATQNCPDTQEQVFQAVQLALNEGDQLIDLQIQILDAGTPTEELDGEQVVTAVPLTVEVTATVRDSDSIERDVAITDPVGIMVTQETGAAIEQGGVTCQTLAVTPGSFTYWVGRNASLQFSHYDINGDACCWVPTEYIDASVTAEVEVDDGQGGTIRVAKRASTSVESIPRPADPCELRAMQSGVPELASYDAYNLIDVGDVYLTDVCGNIVHGVGLSDSEHHDQPGDEFRITSPLDPPGEGVWATALSGNNQWSWGVRLHGDVGTPDQIPDGAYTVDFEVASQSLECSAGGVITGSYTVNTTMGAPQVALWWDWIWDAENSPRGPNPEDVLISPGSAVRDRSGAVAMWRVPAFNDPTVDHFFEGPYTDVPVKLYIAWHGTIPFDEDGNLGPTYLEPVEGVELCTGTIEKLTDAAGHLDWNSPVRTTCDTAWTTFATAQASSDPEDTALNPAGPPDTWVPVGLGVGISKGPDQPGSYLLIAEPLDEAFRRDEAWKVITPYVPDGFIGFEVGGGVFLDKDWVPITDEISLLGERTVYLQIALDSANNFESVTISMQDGAELPVEHPLQLIRVGETPVGRGMYVGQIDLIQAEPGVKRTVITTKNGPIPRVDVTLVRDFAGRVWAWMTSPDDKITDALLRSYFLEFEEARGLYKENGSYQPGYVATGDDKGRIYSNWLYTAGDPSQGEYESGRQIVDFRVSVNGINQPIPAGFVVKWEYEDPDDDSDEQPLFLGTWPFELACQLDANDYDFPACTHRLTNTEGNLDGIGDDNGGFPAYYPNWGNADPPSELYSVEVEEVDGVWTARSQIANGVSEVRFNMRGKGGNNYKVRAKLAPEANLALEGYPAETGTLTIWKKAYIEYRRMASDLNLPWEIEAFRQQLDDVFKFAFVEFQFPDGLEVADDYLYLEPEPPNPGEVPYLSDWDPPNSVGQFHHFGEGLWHFLGLARFGSSDWDGIGNRVRIANGGNPAFTVVDEVTLRLLGDQVLEAGAHSGKAGIVMRTVDGYSIAFGIISNSEDEITIDPLQYGATDYQVNLESMALDPSQATIKEGAKYGVTVLKASLVYVETINEASLEPLEIEEAFKKTTRHELTHPFATLQNDENCGNQGVDGNKCVMTYDFWPVLVPDGQGGYSPDPSVPNGLLLCPFHINLIRVSFDRPVGE